MTDAYIVATARTPIGRAYKGAFNNLEAPTLAGHAIKAAVSRAGIGQEHIDDVIMGCALTQGSGSLNIGRLSALAAGLPVSVPGMTVDRQCSSGMYAIALAAQTIKGGDAEIMVAGGLDSISLIQNKHYNTYRINDPHLVAQHPNIYMPMLQTAEVVAKRYGISRQEQDDYALTSQQRTALAQQKGAFNEEIIPVTADKLIVDKASGKSHTETVTIKADEGNRPETTLEGLSSLVPVMEGGVITAGNASQLSDGASASVLMSETQMQAHSIEPMGRFMGITVSGCEPDEMGIGPIFAVPKLLRQHQLTVADIGVWELNEAFAVQVLYCQKFLDIPLEQLNVNGGAISIGHPYGMSGARMVGHALIEAKKRGEKYIVCTMCIGGGMGAAALFEVL